MQILHIFSPRYGTSRGRSCYISMMYVVWILKLKLPLAYSEQFRSNTVSAEYQWDFLSLHFFKIPHTKKNANWKWHVMQISFWLLSPIQPDISLQLNVILVWTLKFSSINFTFKVSPLDNYCHHYDFLGSWETMTLVLHWVTEVVVKENIRLWVQDSKEDC